MMKTIKIFLLLHIVSFSISCAAENDRVEKEKLRPDGTIEERWQEKKQGDIFVKDGYYKRWNKAGALYTVGQYKNGKKDGKWIMYYPNGDKWQEILFKDGLEDGECYYWKDGKVRILTVFKDGVAIKRFRNENGQFVPVPIPVVPTPCPEK